jgi:hypothetical protein
VNGRSKPGSYSEKQESLDEILKNQEKILVLLQK